MIHPFQMLAYMGGFVFQVFTNADLKLSLSFPHIMVAALTTLYMVNGTSLIPWFQFVLGVY